MVGDLGMALFAPLYLGECFSNSSPQFCGHLRLPSGEEKSTGTATITTTSYSEDSDDDETLVPEELESLRHCQRLLSRRDRRRIRDSLPHRLRSCQWERCYATGRDGDSFCTMRCKCRDAQHSILVLRTTEGHVLGGYASEPWGSIPTFTGAVVNGSNSYYGTGQSFLFASHPLGGNDHGTTEPVLTIYPWSGDNDYHQVCHVDAGRLAMGGGGEFGWIVSEDFTRGVTGSCRTYHNPPLIPNGNTTFDVEALEIYGIVPIVWSLLGSSQRSSTSLPPTMDSQVKE
jgi:hypothetical protein